MSSDPESLSVIMPYNPTASFTRGAKIGPMAPASVIASNDLLPPPSMNPRPGLYGVDRAVFASLMKRRNRQIEGERREMMDPNSSYHASYNKTNS
ncbi:hypothetical protein PENSUB_6065 [Penicillium subrubescens]|uniref:Uncharacterized protein n=1 Tax=Penicillium subrubescens TaxID=1316194 RepID=A0A1Q5U4T0_9EURO|nr:hypothetical protein PENSUB_6065 [Penicillium subrubescens]